MLFLVWIGSYGPASQTQTFKGFFIRALDENIQDDPNDPSGGVGEFEEPTVSYISVNFTFLRR